MSAAPSILRFEQSGSTSNPDAASPRAAGLDWLRAAAALGVVALHAGMPYMTHPLPGLEWCVRYGAGSASVDALCWFANVAVMPTFFLMGGFLAAGLWRRRPGVAFLQHRSRRLLLPLGLAFVLVLPADLYIWLVGWFTEGRIPFQKILSLKLNGPLKGHLWGVAHLWYLQCLWALSLGAWWLQTLMRETPGGTRLAPALGRLVSAPHSRAGLAALGVGSGIVLAADPQFLIGFRQGWFPGPVAVLFYGLWFAAGWGWSTAAGAADNGGGEGRLRLALAAVAFPCLLAAIRRHTETAFEGGPLLALTCGYCLVAALAATGVFSLALTKTAPQPPRGVRFVAEASFWMYLVHHPLAGLCQLALLPVSAPPAAKFAATLGIAVWLSLATYAAFVRKTWIGRLLDGRGTSAATVAPVVGPVVPPAEPAGRIAA
ncbi:MAG: acyltransferase family protein [Planctomyces sp.]|nr:acyltransferase family protein [Planctomyces sp.]